MFSAIMVLLTVLLACLYGACMCLGWVIPALFGFIFLMYLASGSIGEALLLFVLLIISVGMVIHNKIKDKIDTTNYTTDTYSKRTQRERKIEEEYGIIDFSEK